MTDTKKPAAKAVPPKKTGLELMREPFPEHQVSKLPKGTKAQNDCPPAEKINCKVCGGWHHPKVVHLDYVGHAALTDRLLDCDPAWDWQPVSFNADGSPTTDKDGGMWIRLTVCGVTRLGYGDAPQKNGSTATKERIGDALRNAAMRFGAALDLWHKGELHAEEPDYPITLAQSAAMIDHLNNCNVTAEVFCAYANIRSVSELVSSRYEGGMEWIKRRGLAIEEKAKAKALATQGVETKPATPKTASTLPPETE